MSNNLKQQVASIFNIDAQFITAFQDKLISYWNDIYKEIQKLTDGYIFMGLVMFSIIMYTNNLLGSILSTIICVCYPMYDTIYIIDSTRIMNKLIYWAAISVILSCELILGWLTTYIPFYQLIKVAFLMWAFKLDGTTKIRDKVFSILNLHTFIQNRLFCCDTTNTCSGCPNKPHDQKDVSSAIVKYSNTTTTMSDTIVPVDTKTQPTELTTDNSINKSPKYSPTNSTINLHMHTDIQNSSADHDSVIFDPK